MCVVMLGVNTQVYNRVVTRGWVNTRVRSLSIVMLVEVERWGIVSEVNEQLETIYMSKNTKVLSFGVCNENNKKKNKTKKQEKKQNE